MTSAVTEEDLVTEILQNCDAVENATVSSSEGATEYSPSLQWP